MSKCPRCIELLGAVAFAAALISFDEAGAAEEPDQMNALQLDADQQFAYDSNLFRVSPASAAAVLAPGANLSDEVSMTSLEVIGRRGAGRQAFSAEARVTEKRYFQNSELDHLCENGKIAWNWRAADRLSGEIGARYSRNLASFADTQYFHKDLLATQGYFGTAIWQIGGRWGVSSGVSRSQSSHSVEILRSNDYSANAFKGGIEFQSNAGNKIGWEEQYTSANFVRDVTTDSAFLRDYRQRLSALKLSYAPTGKLGFEGDAGYLTRSYPNLGSRRGYSGEVWHWSILYDAGRLMSTSVAGWRDLRANLAAESDYFTSTGVRIEPKWTASARLSLQLQSSWERRRYVGSNVQASADTRHDQVVNLGASASYWTGYAAELVLAYNYERRTSNQLSLKFDDNLVTLGFRFYVLHTEAQ